MDTIAINLLALNLSDVREDLIDASDENLLRLTHQIANGLHAIGDVTMLCPFWNGRAGGRRRVQTKKLTLAATVENIPMLTDFVTEQLEALDCPMKAQMQIDIAMDELFGSIAHYAYSPDTNQATVLAEVVENPLSVIITFIDRGLPYDPLSVEDPDTTLSAEDRGIGGLGIFMVCKNMDKIAYRYKNGAIFFLSAKR